MTINSKSTFSITENLSFKNIAANTLTHVEFFKNTVLYGVNGSGKSTIARILDNPELRAITTNDGSNKTVYTFNQAWIKSHVGEFIEGGAAEGVTTVLLGDDAAETEEAISRKELLLIDLNKKIEGFKESSKEHEKKLKSIKDDIFEGTRKTLETSCPPLNGRSFNRRKIEEYLERDSSPTNLNSEEITTLVNIATATNPGELTTLPLPFQPWKPSAEIWNLLESAPLNEDEITDGVSEWMREGLRIHKAGDNCEFCSGIVTQVRIKALHDAITKAADIFPNVLETGLNECRQAQRNTESFLISLNNATLDSIQYGEALLNSRRRISLSLEGLMRYYENVINYLERRKQEPTFTISREIDDFDFNEFLTDFSSFKEIYDNARKAIFDHKNNQRDAIEKLRSHCCTIDGAGWTEAKTLLTECEQSLADSFSERDSIISSIEDLQRQISTTAAVAEQMDRDLCLILGDRTLRVTAGAEGEGYQIKRHASNAESMSEGEKKLISLLYFCAHLLEIGSSTDLSDSIIVFDDLGSDIDEARLFAIDRFISNFFANRPVFSVVYLTHSFTYFKILTQRLKDKLKKGNAAFYEVYKTNYSDDSQTTAVRAWDKAALNFISDYYLAFYQVLIEFDNVRNEKQMAYGTGNFCRKLLEGFTEFKVPEADQFGSRIDIICQEKEIPVAAYISKLANHLSHSHLDRAGGILSNHETSITVKQTLAFVFHIDPDHFRRMTKLLLEKQRSPAIIDDIEENAATYYSLV